MVHYLASDLNDLTQYWLSNNMVVSYYTTR